MRPASAAVLSCVLAACTDVVIAPDPGGGGAGAGGQPSTTSAASSGGGSAGASEGGSAAGGEGAGGAPAVMPVCASADSFDSGVLDDGKWSAFPEGAFSFVDGTVDLHGDLAYLKLHTQPADCAFTFEIVSLAGGRVSLQIVGEADSLIDVRVDNAGTRAVRWDASTDESDVISSPVEGMPLGLGLLFLDGQITCVARYESAWLSIATFPSPDWFDDEEPEVRFVDLSDGTGSTRVDDYGVYPVPAL